MLPPATDCRHFLSWQKPLLPQAVAFLAQDWQGEGALDLSRVLVVVPTRQAGRRLREALAEFAGRRSQAVFAPRVMTPDGLLKGEVDAEFATASRIESLLAWVAVFREFSIHDFRGVFPVDPPVRNFAWALRLAQQFGKLQATLAENGWRMGDVAEQMGAEFVERERWQQLGRLDALQASRLAEVGRKDVQAVKIAAARRPDLPGIDRVVLLAAPDPLSLALIALEALPPTVPVSVVVFAPELERSNFDAWGRPEIDAWARRPLALPELSSHVHLCANPAAQAKELMELAQQYPDAEGVLGFGVADPEILPLLESALTREGVPSFNPEGRPRSRETLYQLLSVLAALLREPSFATAETLARSPDFIAYLRGECGDDFSVASWLAGMDELRDEHLPADLAAARSHRRTLARFGGLEAGLAAMVHLRSMLREGSFAESAMATLGELYRGREIDPARPVDVRFETAAVAWADIVRECARAGETFGVDLTLNDWWEVALQLFADGVRTDDKPAGALELQGWLELAWENAPHLAVAGLNDGRVPDTVPNDPFLPESLRARLGLKTNAVRLARDAYLLQALAASRESGGRLDLFFGKTSIAGEPLRPSRLLFHCADELLPERVASLFRTLEEKGAAIPWQRAWRLKPRKVEAPARVSVTALRAWLACPLRFYLGQVLKMGAIDPEKNELDALDFGTLCHGALEGLSGPTLRDCVDEKALQDFLLGELDRRVRERYGSALTLPLLVQVESARQRLAKAAQVQARERAEGWVIVAVEKKFEIVQDGLVISGRIDRIERHEKTGAVRVLDYKTSDTAVAPDTVHLRAVRTGEEPPEWARVSVEGTEKMWVDLQLALYRQALAAEFGPDVLCGYFNLPKASADTGLALWEGFSLELQESALRCVAGVSAAIRAGVFWPPNENVKVEYDDFAALFHHGVAASVEWEAAHE